MLNITLPTSMLHHLTDLALVEPGRNPLDEERNGIKGEEHLEILQKTLKKVSEEKETLQAEVSSLKDVLAIEKERVREMWRVNCM